MWRGELKKTAGGLTKKDLIKNKRGRIVSKKKSEGARKENNLKTWLRKPGESFGQKLKDAGKPLPAKKGSKAKVKPVAKKAPIKKKVVKKAPVKPKKVVKVEKKAPAPVKKAKRPAGVGEHPDVKKISIGNIKKGSNEPIPKGWPKWTVKLVNTHARARAFISELIKEFEEDDEQVDWASIKEDARDEFPMAKF